MFSQPLEKPCKIWTGAHDSSGYGMKTIGRRKIDRRTERVHRLAYMEARGLDAIPNGLCVLHRCDVRLCYEPTHLVLGTRWQNAQEQRERNPHNKHGERNPRAKLTWANVDAIRARYAAGAKQQALADEFGISQTQISKIVHHERWTRRTVRHSAVSLDSV